METIQVDQSSTSQLEVPAYCFDYLEPLDCMLTSSPSDFLDVDLEDKMRGEDAFFVAENELQEYMIGNEEVKVESSNEAFLQEPDSKPLTDTEKNVCTHSESGLLMDCENLSFPNQDHQVTMENEPVILQTDLKQTVTQESPVDFTCDDESHVPNDKSEPISLHTQGSLHMSSMDCESLGQCLDPLEMTWTDNPLMAPYVGSEQSTFSGKSETKAQLPDGTWLSIVKQCESICYMETDRWTNGQVTCSEVNSQVTCFEVGGTENSNTDTVNIDIPAVSSVILPPKKRRPIVKEQVEGLDSPTSEEYPEEEFIECGCLTPPEHISDSKDSIGLPSEGLLFCSSSLSIVSDILEDELQEEQRVSGEKAEQVAQEVDQEKEVGLQDEGCLQNSQQPMLNTETTLCAQQEAEMEPQTHFEQLDTTSQDQTEISLDETMMSNGKEDVLEDVKSVSSDLPTVKVSLVADSPTQEDEPVPSALPPLPANQVDWESAQQLSSRLYNLDGFKKAEVAPYLYKNNDFSKTVAEEYMKNFDFSGLTLEQALRSFLKVMVLIGETQERERVLQHFAVRYHTCNPNSFNSAESVLTLTCALMLLNTDLHGQNLGKAMTCSSFVSNLDGMNDEGNFPKDLLKSLYNSIKNEKLEWAIDEEELQNTLMPQGEDSVDGLARNKSNPFLDVAHDQKAKVYKQGFLTRKAHADIDGKKTPWGKRSWKVFYAVLKGMVLYLQKNECKPNWQNSEEVISVHHALAEQAVDYTKRPNVFRLQTADWRVFLFKASNTEQMNSWICRINLVAALFSSPPFPAAVGSQKKFVRPILPAAQSKNTQEEQLTAHSSWLEIFTYDLEDHQQNPPEGKKGRTRDLDHRVKEEYLQYEKSRYEVYVNLLQAKKKMLTEDLDHFDTLVCDAVETEEASLQKSHSSPSLNLESAAPIVKVKRNISERRTYRKIIVPRRNRDLL
ncbi:PH and SEC7 domain-containing protein 2-like [Erpetoichthys calabaricus]|uniref:PH and SEC7 domain-containing protein 2-like n=1 Tax=Erpetoichthys calabaricus TaxID=27687 RepID=UPI002234084A|nr:PH and SEC7 domain-containing protein 2-like [Erpetoichthys calabaricus]XP_028653547.2 PH and SEC7 domain-containing protein 2-like [Erpetoichthys calabaricus]XP_051792207.1 PH and SEC7 domain-containing protein 2-like [Erpetoichthys calabaricus]XP_051792213.1 PH and SEC7 domain-containing protein 2-like [Erpetoichthys calabaricus]XP_051792217.1 PH and SEC7 domain-containing protein 2-like [Erpetoichthys calabaricus]